MHSPEVAAQHTISVVIPLYNSAAMLPELMERLARVLPTLTDEFEVILVNDGSRDESWPAAKKAAKTYPFVHAINLMRNYGQHNALLCGIRSAKYATTVTMDDDLQHPPEEIPKLLAKLDTGFDVVYGTPASERHGFWRDLASQVTKLALQNAMNIDVARDVSAFRAFRTLLRGGFAGYSSPYVSLDVLLTWTSTKFSSVTVRHDTRKSGVSNYTFWNLVTHALNMITGYSTKPLQLASVVGLVFTFFGFIVLVWVIVQFFISGSVVPGFPFLASIIAIFSGAQLFALGIIGEYLARMHFRTMDRPTYAVRADTRTDA
ncbi:MAG: glycosyltransferase family 2 protein [Capsulimonas sp.]|uniref:glycosyltransferase family 2 protein n=1 Tax=Capsulimonas sp. TaxID=2494211 RepID=UPI003262E647